jgi:hypothetical protein
MILRRTKAFVLNSTNPSPNIVGESPQSSGIAAPSVPIAKVFGNREEVRGEEAFVCNRRVR